MKIWLFIEMHGKKEGRKPGSGEHHSLFLKHTKMTPSYT